MARKKNSSHKASPKGIPSVKGLERKIKRLQESHKTLQNQLCELRLKILEGGYVLKTPGEDVPVTSDQRLSQYSSDPSRDEHPQESL